MNSSDKTKPFFDFTSMTSDELFAFWESYRRAGKAARLAVCGHTGKGSKLATEAACNYAVNLSTAMLTEATGRRQAAGVYYRICKNIAPDLPDTIKIR